MESERDRVRIENAWERDVYTVPVTPEAISYTAGYCAKKIDAQKHTTHLRINYETGEEYEWIPPFLQMSRRPGIGGNARRHTQSWRDFAILNGTRLPVPTYLHKAWEDNATREQIEQREHEQYLRKLTKERITPDMLRAQEQILMKQQSLQAEKRQL